MWWAMWCAAVLARSAVSAPVSDTMSAIDLSQIDTPTSDDDGVSFGEPPMDARYDSNVAPWIYPLALKQSAGGESERARVKRRMTSLSIDLPMAVLRQKLSQEKERRVQALQAAANRNFLNDIGKRGAGGERRPRLKRKMPSLSINNPMEVLRQRLLQEVVRKQMREANQRQAFANRLFLQNVGKRGYWTNSGSNHYNRYDD